MQRALLGFCAGALVLGLPWPGTAWLPELLAPVCAAGLLLLAVLSGSRRLGSAPSVLWAGVLLGLGWSALAHQWALQARLPFDVANAAIPITIRLLDEPAVTTAGGAGPAVTRFQGRVVEAPDGAPPTLRGAILRLSWYGAPRLRQGETWRVQARLRGPWSYANPGGFDYERWLLGRRIHGTGWIRHGELVVAAAPGPLARLRGAVVARIESAELAQPGVLKALLVGRSEGIDQTLWDILRATGTVHLMVISGLHVSLVTALGFFVGRGLCRLCPLLPLVLDARRAGCLVGGLAAVGYVALAGAGLPALRALIMGAAVLVLLAAGRRGRPDGLLLLALTGLLLLEPLAVHQQGFWLSFAAVGLLLLALGPRLGARPAAAPLRAQLALSLGMLPLLTLITGTVPWTAAAANLLAVPVMTGCVVPVALLAGLLAPLWSAAAELALALADRILGLLLGWLELLSVLPTPLPQSGATALLLSQCAALWWLLGAPRRHWPALLLCLTAPLVPAATGLAAGEYRVTALDVGQGTAVSIDTRRHRLMYDAGPGFPGGFETGSAVVVPSLAATGPTRLDVLILSHDDVDHSGGADAVIAALAPRRILAGSALNDQPSAPVESCHGVSWVWDAVRFQLLDVERPAGASDNDRSCILLVDDGRRRTLIAGDVSAAVEGRLLRQLAGSPALALMFAPHHGSITSSSTALVRVARPTLVFVSAGRGNRFGHPHGRVVERYRRVGARLYQTGREGALVWRSGDPLSVVRWRRQRAPYWRAGSGGS